MIEQQKLLEAEFKNQAPDPNAAGVQRWAFPSWDPAWRPVNHPDVLVFDFPQIRNMEGFRQVVTIDPEGRVSFPTPSPWGDFVVAGLTTPQIKEKLGLRIRDLFEDMTLKEFFSLYNQIKVVIRPHEDEEKESKGAAELRWSVMQAQAKSQTNSAKNANASAKSEKDEVLDLRKRLEALEKKLETIGNNQKPSTSN